jgi:glyoxylase-like metal-dependent hydrolase (beta-lactamase superfamily II)
MSWTRILLAGLGLIAAIGAGAYYWLIVESHMPFSGSYSIDIAELRKLADSQDGAKPMEIRVETVGIITFPKTAVVAGDGWDSTELPVSAYQLVYPDHTAVIDTAYDAGTAAKATATNSGFDDAAYKRIVAGLNGASMIVVTHEHWDHAATLLVQPNLKELLGKTLLTTEQLANTDRLVPAEFPSDARTAAKTVSYGNYLAVAPGVVLVKSPGHTPGSQSVYVRLANGKEYLFIGDVAWHQRNIDIVRERARLVTWWFMNEDRDQVMLELAELNRLQKANPDLVIVPGHDPEKLAAMKKSGLLLPDFR